MKGMAQGWCMDRSKDRIEREFDLWFGWAVAIACWSYCRGDRGIHSSSHDSRRRYLSDAYLEKIPIFEERSVILMGLMVTRGVCSMYFQHYIRVISLVQKGRYYSEEYQRHSDRGSNPKKSSIKGNNPKRRMALCHWFQRERVNHIDVIDVYWWGEIVTLNIDVEHALSTSWHQ